MLRDTDNLDLNIRHHLPNVARQWAKIYAQPNPQLKFRNEEPTKMMFIIQHYEKQVGPTHAEEKLTTKHKKR